MLLKSFLSKFFSDHVRFTFATLLTSLRIIMTPFIVYAILNNAWEYALVIFFGAALTDLFDGAVARAFNQETLFGSCLDPIADKIFITSSFLALAYSDVLYFKIPEWFLFLVFIREVIIVSGAFLLQVLKPGVFMNPSFLGKMTMMVYVCSVMLFLISCVFDIHSSWLYSAIFSITSIFIIFSLMHYVFLGFSLFKRVSV